MGRSVCPKSVPHQAATRRWLASAPGPGYFEASPNPVVSIPIARPSVSSMRCASALELIAAAIPPCAELIADSTRWPLTIDRLCAACASMAFDANRPAEA